MNIILRNTLFFCSFLLSVVLFSQPTDCITFNQPALNTVFDETNTIPGDVIHEYDGVNLVMNLFTEQAGNTSFGEIGIVEGWVAELNAPSLLVNHANAQFQYAEPVNTLCFTTNISGPEINFGLNGEVGVFDDILDPNILEEWPNYNITVTSNGDIPEALATMCIFGPIESFTIGGIELLVDDVCTAFNNVCAFNDPNLETFCLNNEAVSLSIDFSSVFGTNNFVDLYIDNEFHSFHAINDFPIVLENLIPNGQQEEVSVTVCINDDPNCCYNEILFLEDCSPIGCGFNDPNVQAYCNNLGGITVNMDFSSVIGNNEFVDVYIDNEFINFFPVNSFPILLENVIPYNQQEMVSVTVCINDDPNCCYNETVTLQGCGTEFCVFNDPNIQAYCLNNEAASVSVDFNYIVGNNNFVDIFVDGEFHSFHAINSFPVILENLIPNSQQEEVTITVCINDDPGCCYSENIPLPDCSTEDCITFDEPEVGTIFSADTGYEPGALIYQYPNANLSINSFISNGTINFDQIAVVEGWDVISNSPALYINYATATFDFHTEVNELCFVASISGHEINFGLNGQLGVFESLLDPNLLAEWPDYDFSITPLDPGISSLVSVCISGPINSFTIGGIELLLDDVCTYEPSCSISNLQVAQYACDDNATPPTFYLNFQHNRSPIDSFFLYVGGDLFGTYAYADLPLTGLQFPFIPPGTNLHILVRDALFVECAEDVGVAYQNCDLACSNFAVTLADLTCASPNSISVQMVLSAPPTGMPVIVQGISSGVVISEALYTDWGGINFTIEGEIDPEGYLITSVLTGCQTTLPPFEFNVAECQHCTMEVTALEPTDCNPNNVYGVYIDLETSTPWHQFTVTIDGDQVYGPFSADEFPLTVGSIVGEAGTVVPVEIHSTTSECSFSSFVTQDCSNVCTNFGAGLIGVECLAPSEILVVFDLSGVEVGEPLRISSFGGNFVEEIIFTGNPIQLLLPPSSTPFYQLLIEAQELGCETELFFDVPPNCHLNCDERFDIIEAFCEGNQVAFRFTAEGQAGTLFFVAVQDELYTYQYGEEVYFLAIDGNPSATIYELVFFETQGNCEVLLSVENPCPPCNDFEAELIELECQQGDTLLMVIHLTGIPIGEPIRITNSNGGFVHELIFEGEPFQVSLPLNISSPVVTLHIQAQASNCETTLTVTIPPDCYDNCSNFSANILSTVCMNTPNTGLEVFLTGIDPNGQEIIVQNTVTGTTQTVLLEENPFFLPWPVGDDGVLVFTNPLTGCAAEIPYQTPDECFLECEAGTFAIHEVYCSADGIPVILFTAVGPEGSPFTVQVQGEEYAFNFGQELYDLAVYNSTGDLNIELRFENPQGHCATEIVVDNPCFCFIEVLTAEATECNDIGEFFIELEFIAATSWNTGIFLVEAGGYTQTFEEGTISTTIGPFNSAIHSGVDIIISEINHNGGVGACQEVVVVQSICDPVECETYDLVIEGTECSNDGTYYLEVDFESNVNGPFVITNQATGETIIATLDELPVQMGPLNIHEIQTSLIIVYHAETNNCLIEEEYVQECEPLGCDIFGIQVEGTDCTPNGIYFLNVYIQSNYEGPFLVTNLATGQSVEATINDLPVQFGPINYNEIQTSVILVEGINVNCADEVVYVHECEPFCPIEEVYILEEFCDPNGFYSFYVGLNATHNGPYYVTNQETGEVISQVFLDDFPLSFGPYDVNEVPYAAIRVTYEIAGAPTCSEVVVHEPDCEPQGECDFNDIFAEAYECIDGEFMVDIAFNNPNGGALGFYIFGDGMIFGPYQYGQNFYTFGPLDGSEEEHDILLLDIANPACFGSYTLNNLCSDECNILEVVATVSDCDGELFGVQLDVIGSNLGETFVVVGNGNNYGTFSYADLPISLGPFEGDNQTVYEFGVIDLQNPTCTSFTAIEPVNCQPCDIRDLVYEVECGTDGYSLTIDFIHENTDSDLFALQIGGEVYEWFEYSALPLTLSNLSYDFNGSTIRVEDIENELCGETIDFNIPCCTLGNAINEIGITDCFDDGEYFFRVNPFNGGNLSDSLVINYAPAGSSIIATVVVAYSDLPQQIGPLNGNGTTSYIVVLNDQENSCAVTTTIEPVFCDNSTCVEFEGVEGVFAPAFGYDSGDEITTENGVLFTYERNPSTNCACNLFVTDGIPGINFGSGHIVATQNSGFGLEFSNVTQLFNTVNIDFYYTGGEKGIAVNGETPVIVSNINDFPVNIAPGVELQVTLDPNNPGTGMLTFSGAHIESILLFTDDSAGFDNVCLSMDDNVWPGDTNSDNVANHIDLLSIGLTYEYTGPARISTNSEWAGLISQNWGGDFADGINHKHADANGDGVVNVADELVLQQNYGLSHGPNNGFEALPYTDLDPPIFVDISETDQLPAGTAVEIPVVAGSADQMIENIYGLAFSLQLDPAIFNMASLQIVYPTSWFGEPEINTTMIDRAYPDGHVDVAITRTDHNNVSGFGPILYLRIIIDDIAGINEIPTELVVKNLIGINHNEELQTLRPGVSHAMVTKTTGGEIDKEALMNSFGIFPNPTYDLVFFQNQYNMAPNRVDVFNAAGQHLSSIREPGMQLDMRSYPAGVYMIQIHLEGQIFTERLVKLK